MAKQKGIDISYWQGNVDFSKVKKDGIQFAILREGYRKAIDENFIDYVTGCKNNGIPVVGVYHFLYSLTEADALAEAKSCVANVKKAGLGKDVIIFADFEYDTVTKAKAKGVTLGKAQCIAHTKTFCEYVESQGYKAGIYTNIDYYKNMYSQDLISKYVFWLAHYTSGNPAYTCAFQQYSSSGKVNGINGNVDMDYYFGEIKQTTTTTKKTVTITTKKSVVSVNFSQYYGKISNSGCDESGGIHGGAAGDQTGNEWCIRSWYNSPWSCVLRHPNQEVRELIAELGIEAANNNKIGYDQYQRDTYWNQLQAVGYRPSKITVACESDCSAGVIANTKAAGYLLGISALKNIGATYTGNMRSAYQNAGFQVLTDSKYLTSGDYLVPGDILLNDTHHTATNLGIGSKSGYSGNGNSSIPVNDSTNNTPSNPSKPSTAVKWQGKVTADELNVRTWAGTENGTCSFSPLKEGTIIDVCDTVYASNGSAWYYIKYNGKYGFVHSSYVAKVATTTTTTKKATTTTKKTTTTTKKTTTGVTAQDAINIMNSWVGKSRSAGTHHDIIDLYNSHKPLARGYAVTYSDAYCDTTISAVFIKLNAVDLIGGTECGVEAHVALFKKAGIWEEDGTVTPQPGWLIVYNWDDGSQPNDGYSDHIGMVEKVSGNTITCIEGNMSGGIVGRRNIPIGYGYIRGYAKPKYVSSSSSTNTNTSTKKTVDELAKEVLSGLWGNGDDRKNNLTNAGYDYNAVQNKVNELVKGTTTTTKKVTTTTKKTTTTTKKASSGAINKTSQWKGVVTASALNVRTWAGTENGKCSFSPLYKGTVIDVCDTVKDKEGTNWYYIKYNNKYGFVSSLYVKKK